MTAEAAREVRGGVLLALDETAVRRIAQLARIRVPDDEIERLSGELSGILGWIEKLREVDIEGVEPMTGAVDTVLRERPDAVSDGGYAERILANAPETAGGHFVVPKVVE